MGNCASISSPGIHDDAYGHENAAYFTGITGKESQTIGSIYSYDDSPGLAMSRAFGDFVLKNNGIICIPDVSYHRLTPEDTFLVLASDGVWDVLSNEQVMSIVAAAHSEEGAAKAVVDAAHASWKHKFPSSKRDDCTVICLFLHNK